MYHKIRITVVSLAVMMICMLSTNATLSYFTDNDVKTNDFVVGNASTSLTIYDDITGDKHEFDANTLPPLEDNQDIPFYLQATNEGNIPVYHRFRVVIPKALADVITLELPDMDDSCHITTTSENSCSNTDYTVTFKPSVDNTYAEYYITNNQVLAVGQSTSEWPTMGIHIDGLSETNKALFTCANNDNNNCVLGINAYSDVVQTTGFMNATAAFESLAETY